MYWIIIPPVILIASLSGLIYFVKRKRSDPKTSELIRSYQSSYHVGIKKEGFPLGRSFWQRIWRLFIFLWENLLKTLKRIASATEKKISEFLVKKHSIEGETKTDKTAESLKYIKKPSESEQIYYGQEFILDETIYDLEDHNIKSEELIEDYKQKTAEKVSPLTKKAREVDFAFKQMQKFKPEDKKLEEALIYRIAENPKDVDAYREIGDYYLSVGNVKDAKESFKMVLKLRPRDLKAKSRLREIEMILRLKISKT